MPEPEETQARQGRAVTDEDAREISRVEELSYELRISETMTRDVMCSAPNTRITGLLDLLRVRHMSGMRYWKRKLSILRG